MAETEEKKSLTLEEAKRYRMFLRIAFFLVAFVAPCLIIGFTFKLFTQATFTKWSITGLTLLLIVGWRFKKRIGEWVTSWEDSNIFKHILMAIGKIWPFLLVVSILGALKLQTATMISTLDKAMSCLQWTSLCELVAYLGIYPFEMKMDYKVKRLIRKQERKEDYKEAIKEMENEEQGE